mmetsp:Transcript_130227/g.417988  ORF Transcript_130227/g.417988 Transcript_130227/m.417988 type:complete len:282 (+) Transcript_130227:391-1236(+)
MPVRRDETLNTRESFVQRCQLRLAVSPVVLIHLVPVLFRQSPPICFAQTLAGLGVGQRVRHHEALAGRAGAELGQHRRADVAGATEISHRDAQLLNPCVHLGSFRLRLQHRWSKGLIAVHPSDYERGLSKCRLARELDDGCSLFPDKLHRSFLVVLSDPNHAVGHVFQTQRHPATHRVVRVVVAIKLWAALRHVLQPGRERSARAISSAGPRPVRGPRGKQSSSGSNKKTECSNHWTAFGAPPRSDVLPPSLPSSLAAHQHHQWPSSTAAAVKFAAAVASA